MALNLLSRLANHLHKRPYTVSRYLFVDPLVDGPTGFETELFSDNLSAAAGFDCFLKFESLFVHERQYYRK